MTAMIICEVCGNEREGGARACRFCGAAGDKALALKRPQYKVINLEKGMPLVSQALTKLDHELAIAQGERYRILSLIHGYGSSGRGGAIRGEVRSQLRYMKEKNLVNDFLPGEEFSTRTGKGRHFLQRFPFLKELNELNRGNQGITLVAL